MTFSSCLAMAFAEDFGQNRSTVKTRDSLKQKARVGPHYGFFVLIIPDKKTAPFRSKA